MRRQTVVTALVVAIAGCGGSVSPGDDGGSGEGTVNMYISDQPSAIDDFDHLNATIEKVGIHRADAGENESAWVEKSVDNRTVDLSELQRANAASLGVLNVSNGTYDKTFVYVDEVNGTLIDGDHPDVKLPSSKLQLNSEFTVGNGEQIDYVFDITVVKRGNSGRYNIKSVAGESGTGEQVEIEKRGEDDEAEDEETGTETENETATENETETGEPELSLSLEGDATAGENVTASVTQNGSTVANATVNLGGEAVGDTGENGTIVVAVPADAEELELEAEHDGAEGEATFPVQRNGTGTAALAAPALALP